MTNQAGASASSSRYLETFFNRHDLKRFAFPGRLLWGRDARAEVAAILGDAECVDCYVDAHFAGHTLTEELLAPLGARVRRRYRVAGEPRAQAVLAESETYESPDAVVAIGGGSTIDFAKAVICGRLYGRVDGIGMGALRGIDPPPASVRPTLVAVPTTAGTGADASRYFVTYDANTKSKVHGKSWRLIADWSVLDPAFLRECPEPLLVASAFDAFVHLFESMVSRGEQSWFGAMLSLDAIPRLVGSLDAILRQGDRSDERLLELQYAASLGGIAISNVRTGNIHEAAGALLEATNLSHPETLLVFFASAYDQYASATALACSLLADRVAAAAPETGISTMADLVDWWTERFRLTGSLARIRAEVGALRACRTDAEARIFDRVWSDRVWVEKESPVPLSEAEVRAFITRSLEQHGLEAD